MKYREVLEKVYKGDLSKVPPILLGLDPGETTGYAVFKNGFLETEGQFRSANEDKQPIWTGLEYLFYTTRPTQVVCENYRVYGHKLTRHANSEIVTVRLIGGIDLICYQNRHGKQDMIDPIPIHYQMAAQAKGFVTDARLKDWGFWKPGEAHSRDAIRHCIYYLLVTNRPEVKK